MKQLLIAMIIGGVLGTNAYAECKHEYPKPVEINEAELTDDEKQLLAELKEVEQSDPELVALVKEIAENWESYGFTKCPVPELD